MYFFNFRKMETSKESPCVFKTPCKPAKVKSPGRAISKRYIFWINKKIVSSALYQFSCHRDDFLHSIPWQFLYVQFMIFNSVLSGSFVISQCMWNPSHHTCLSLYEEAWLWNWSQCVSHGQVGTDFIHACYKVLGKLKNVKVQQCLRQDGEADSFSMGY